jgi:hypothetical protein
LRPAVTNSDVLFKWAELFRMLGAGDPSSPSPVAPQGRVVISKTGFHPSRYRNSPNQISGIMIDDYWPLGCGFALRLPTALITASNPRRCSSMRLYSAAYLSYRKREGAGTSELGQQHPSGCVRSTSAFRSKSSRHMRCEGWKRCAKNRNSPGASARRPRHPVIPGAHARVRA